MKYIACLTFLLFCSLAMKAQTMEELNNALQQATNVREKMVINFQMAEIYHKENNKEKALEKAKATLQYAQEIKNNGFAARAAYMLGEIYERLRDTRNAEIYYKTCLFEAKAAGDSDLIIQSVRKRSSLATKDNNYRRAYDINQEAFDYFSTKGNSISDLEGKFETQKSVIDKEKKTLLEEKNRLEKDIASLASERDQLSTDKSRLENKQQELVKEKARVEESVSEKENALVLAEEEKRKVEQIATQKQRDYKKLSRAKLEQEAALAQAESEIKSAKLAIEQEKLLREKEKNKAIIIGLAGFFAVLIFIILYLSSRKAKASLERKNKLIALERERSDELLFNILPKAIGEELKESGKARAQKFEQVTVLFTDFKNFTRISERLSPEELVQEIDRCFKSFDFIISQYPDIEKIKTIGDAYMCASGLNPTATNMPDNLLRAALEMQEFLNELKAERSRMGKPFFEARIGMHTGPVVAGVVGVNKFAYDIWGDTVNIAARMESQCEEGRINISETTYNLVRYNFECSYRGKLEAKNKGAIDMYYVDREFARATYA
jgi:adenylate cyclase